MDKQWDMALGQSSSAPPLQRLREAGKCGQAQAYTSREQGLGRGAGSLPTPGHRLHILCTPCHSHIPSPSRSDSPLGSTAGLPNTSAKNHSSEKSLFHTWLASLGQHFKSMEPVTEQLKEPLSVTITAESDGTGNIHSHQK